jgi:hypothetical protein
MNRSLLRLVFALTPDVISQEKNDRKRGDVFMNASRPKSSA